MENSDSVNNLNIIDFMNYILLPNGISNTIINQNRKEELIFIGESFDVINNDTLLKAQQNRLS